MKKTSILLIVLLLAASLLVTPAAATDAAAEPPHDGYIVRLRPDAAGSVLSDRLEECYAPQQLYTVQYPEQVLSLLEAQAIEHFEPNYFVSLQGWVNDPYFKRQWNLKAINMEQAWSHGITADGVCVALIDSGLNLEHEDILGSNILVEDGVNMLTGSRDLTDKTGHGTFVAGIIAATRNNGKGISGINDDLTILPLKCFGSSADTNLAYIVSAIYKAVDKYDCDVINLSLGLEKDVESLRTAIEYAASKDVIIVSSVGNSGGELMLYPAAYPDVIGVGSIDRNRQVSDFSERNESVFITAPGEGILGLSSVYNREYISGTGTSFSSPHIAGLAAIARGYDPTLSPDRFRLLLAASADDCGSSVRNQYGYGIVNAGQFVDFLTSGTPSAADFPDLDGHWARVDAERCLRLSLMQGVSETAFEPDRIMTRAMLVQLLFNLDGRPFCTAGAFADVSPDAWYYRAVVWAAEKQIVSGTEDQRFWPDEPITREQMAVILWRFAQYKGLNPDARTDLNIYLDTADITPFAVDALSWANAAGIIGGVGDGMLAPQGVATRAQAAAIISRMLPALNTPQPDAAADATL